HQVSERGVAIVDRLVSGRELVIADAHRAFGMGAQVQEPIGLALVGAQPEDAVLMREPDAHGLRPARPASTHTELQILRVAQRESEIAHGSVHVDLLSSIRWCSGSRVPGSITLRVNRNPTFSYARMA